MNDSLAFTLSEIFAVTFPKDHQHRLICLAHRRIMWANASTPEASKALALTFHGSVLIRTTALTVLSSTLTGINLTPHTTENKEQPLLKQLTES